MRDITIELGKASDLLAVSMLYDDLNDELARGINYPGWLKNIYPTKETALEGIEEGTLYIAKLDEEIAGTIILNSKQPGGYETLEWSVDEQGEEVMVIHTLAVHPKFLRYGIARRLLEFADQLARTKAARTIRLDVYTNNLPAIKLYESCGYAFVGEVDLGYAEYGLDLFKCFDKKTL